jgi:hypothetical protein
METEKSCGLLLDGSMPWARGPAIAASLLTDLVIAEGVGAAGIKLKRRARAG